MRLPHRSYPLQTDAAGTLPADDFGPFRVLHQVGAGALGPVFRAYDPERDRLVALKLIRLDMPPDRAHALVAELRHVIDAGLTHPVLAAPIAAGLADVTPYLVQEFVSADSLDLVVRDHGAMRPSEAVRVATQLAAALDFAAGVNVCHGALHPRDVLMSSDDVRLTGAGLAQALEQAGLTPPLRRPYTAPERVAGELWSRPADVFSLAAVICELLTGRRISASGDQAASGLSDKNPALRRVFARALAERPEDRFRSATAFAEALQEVVLKGEEPVKGVAPLESPRQRRGRAIVARAADRSPGLPLDAELTQPAAPVPLLGAADTMIRETSAPAVTDFDLAPTMPSGMTDLTMPDLTMSIQGASDRTMSDGAIADLRLADGEMEDGEMADGEMADGEMADGETADREMADRQIVDSEFPVSEIADDQMAIRQMPDGPIAVRHIADTVVPDRQLADSSVAETVVADVAIGHRPFTDSEIGRRAPTQIGDGPIADRQIPERPLFSADEPAPSRGILPMVLTLGLGIALGFAGGYALGTTRDATPGDAATASAVALSAASRSGSFAPDGRPSSPATEFTESAIAETASDPVAPVAVPVDESSGAAFGPIAPIQDVPLSSASAAAPARPPAPEPTRTAPSTGRLFVRSSPSGARVFLDGKEIGPTPATAPSVARGTHSVRVVRDGFVAVERRVTVTAANPSLSLTVELTRATAAGRANAPASRPAAAATAGQYTGALFIESRPSAATVTVDGRAVGTTPLSLESLGAGEHAVRIELDGYRRWTASVRVTAGERRKVAASLERP